MLQQYSSVIFIVLIIVVMYFTMIKPQKKRQQQHQQTINSLKKGDHVVTIGRLHGVVDEIDQTNKTVTLDCDGIFLEFDLNAVASVKAADAKPTTETEQPAKSTEAAKDDQAADDSDK
ncbi:preprotein translocase subunit YajC [Nicoliella lavandulae]|uniref:Preprotein translocase subunit YajC n=1 Tax=Nicoliella lavandulae TaxID=3082954 RepID=A0ABU8SKH3_9LACO